MTKKTKDKDYYMSQPYRYLIWQDPDDGYWNIEIPALKGCRSDGQTIAEALVMIEDAKDSWIEAAIERGIAIPESDIPVE